MRPTNASYGATFSFEDGNGKLSATGAFNLTPVLMGARVYIPSMGRFTSVDPDPGSLPNLYTYPLDPINESDLSGGAAADRPTMTRPAQAAGMSPRKPCRTATY